MKRLCYTPAGVLSAKECSRVIKGFASHGVYPKDFLPYIYPDNLPSSVPAYTGAGSEYVVVHSSQAVCLSYVA